MPTTDTLQPKLEALQTALQSLVNTNQYVADHISPDPITVDIIPGDQAIIDDCCPGYSWVRVVRAYPSISFPTPVTGRIDCPPPSFAADIEIGIVRCASVPDANGNPPTAADLLTDARIVGVDRSILFQAITCVAVADLGRDLRLGSWVPMSTLGGCMGGAVTVTVAYRGCCD